MSSVRDERFIPMEIEASSMTFAYDCDGVTILVGGGGRVYASYPDGDDVRTVEIADPRMVRAFVNFTKAAMMNGIREQTGDTAALLAQLGADDRRPFRINDWKITR